MPPAAGKGWHRLAHVSLFFASSILIASAFAGVLGMRDDPAAGSVNLEAPAVAVLPFVNLSGDARQDYFSDGLTDELVSALMRVEGLRVTGRTSAFALKGMLGEAYLYAGRHDETQREAQRLLQDNPQSWGAHNLLARSFMAAGNQARAAAALERSRGELWADALALVALGDGKGARELIDLHRARIGTTQPFSVASLYASAGDLGQALSWLERAYAMRQVDLVSLAVDPALTPLKSEPRFQSLVRRIGLGQQLSLTAAR